MRGRCVAVVLGVLSVISPIPAAVLASTPAFEDQREELTAKLAASKEVFNGHTPEEIQAAAESIFHKMNKAYIISLSDGGVYATLSWIRFVGVNQFGMDYWAVKTRPVEGGVEVEIRARSKQNNSLFVEMPTSEPDSEIPIVSGSGLAVEEMKLFFKRLNLELANNGGWVSCAEEFGADAHKYQLTCPTGRMISRRR